MRWMLIAFVVSFVALLAAAAALALHILQERSRRRIQGLETDKVEEPETEEVP